jgi:hypothetical protein
MMTASVRVLYENGVYTVTAPGLRALYASSIELYASHAEAISACAQTTLT